MRRVAQTAHRQFRIRHMLTRQAAGGIHSTGNGARWKVPENRGCSTWLQESLDRMLGESETLLGTFSRDSK